MPEAGQSQQLWDGAAAKHCPVQAEPGTTLLFSCAVPSKFFQRSLLPDRKMKTVGPKQMGLQGLINLGNSENHNQSENHSN